MTNTTNSNAITLSTFGVFCKEFKTGEKNITCSIKSMSEYGIDNAKDIVDFAQKLYISIGSMMDLRQSQGLTVDNELLSASESEVKILSDNWFRSIGTRPAKTGETKLRPCYGTRYADFAIYGEIIAQAMSLANNDLTKVGGKFFELLVINTARILTGEKLGRVTESEFARAKAEANSAKTEKAAQTKAANAQKLIEELEKESAISAKIDKLEITVANQSEKLEQAIKLVMASHATKAEKAEIVKLLATEKTENVVE